jgi:hypothetical protein
MDVTDFASNVFLALASNDDDAGPASLPTMLPAPPRMPNLRLVVSNADAYPMETRATMPALRLVHGSRPSVPPPSIPPTASTPIRRAA